MRTDDISRRIAELERARAAIAEEIDRLRYQLTIAQVRQELRSETQSQPSR